ncbi:MAG: two-component regulator propeller domain-containing protein [Bacteroides sp.]|nr:two-component regulator propeller domain-containing protein [Bacteroides sp.]
MQENKQHRRVGILVLVMLLTGTLIHASVDHKFISYSNNEGLNQNTINALEQDHQGNLWIGSPNGLIKYDGYDFHEYSWNPNSHHGLSNNKIIDIHSDRAGMIWIVNSKGIQIFDPSTEKFHTVKLDPSTRPKHLVVKNDSTLWVLGQDYLASLSAFILNDSLRQDLSSNLLSEDIRPLLINDLLQINEEKILLASNLGLYLMKVVQDGRGGLMLSYLEPTSFPRQAVNRICARDETIWIGSQMGLHKAFLDSDQLLIIENYLPDPGNPESLQGNNVTDLLVDINNQLWIGTQYGGLSVYNESGNDFTNYISNPLLDGTLSSSMVNCLYEDEFDIIWIGTAQGGLCKLDLHQKNFINYKNNPFDNGSIPGNLVTDILEDSLGYLWVSTYMGPLCRSRQTVSDRTVSELEFDRFDTWFETFRYKRSISLNEDEEGFIWIGYQGAMVVYHPDKRVFREVSFTLNNEQAPLSGPFMTPARDGLMVVGNRPILLIENPSEILNEGAENPIPVLSSYRIPNNSLVISSLVDRKGQLWIGTKDMGLFLFDLSQKKLDPLRIFTSDKNNATSNLNNGIFSLHEDSEGQIWVGSFGGGLYRITGETPGSYELQYVDTRGQLTDDAIYGILEEGDHKFWLSTDMGLGRFDKSTSECIVYNMNDGLLNNNFRMGAYHAGSSGYFYFGGLNGLTCFRPENIRSNHIPPRVQIEKIAVNNEALKMGDKINRRFTFDQAIANTHEIVLNPRNQSISFEILVRHHATPQNNRMTYMLNGFDKDWRLVASGKYTATYMNLPPGNYRLEINGYNGDGLISEQARILDITVLKPWFWQWWSILLYIIFSIVAIGSMFLYLVKLERLKQTVIFEQKDKLRITEINQAKLKFFTNISHEFRTLLSLISAPLQILMDSVDEGEQRKYLGLIDKNAKKLGFLIDQLLSFRKIEKEKMELKLVKTTLGDLIYPIGEAFELFALKSNLQFDYTVSSSDTSFILDYNKMEMVVFNLLSNAFKFTPARGKVTLECKPEQTERGESVQITITDTGIGIAEDKLKLIFERFYQVDSELSGTGTGIGLSYSKSIVELHQGSLRVNSKPGIETTFTISFPLISGNEMEIPKVDVMGSRTKDLLALKELKSSLKSPGELINDEAKSTILVVDDKVEFCNLLGDILNPKYRVINAQDGKEALEKTIQFEPDLVITDVMMPGINGFELCKKIKSEVELCHIPVILITALGIEQQIVGAEHGADEYISKPFDVNYLVTKIEQLIENGKRIQEHFSQFQSLPETLSLSVTDKNFMLKVNESIRRNLDNSSFTVEELARELNFSSSLVYRKLKLFTGQIPSGYLRNFRLQVAAARIRKDPYVSMKTVRYDVGFASASHFTRSFKEKFGETPTEFAKKII